MEKSVQFKPAEHAEPGVESGEDSAADVAAATRLSSLQLKRSGDGAATHAAAERGLAAPTTSYPHKDQIEASLGQPVTATAVTGAADACGEMGAQAYASGDRVAFKDSTPDLHTAAHEAAHTMQQAQGVQLKGGIGEAGDSYERQADQAADLVVSGQSAAHLFAGNGQTNAAAGATGGAVQLKPAADDKAAIASIRAAQHEIDEINVILEADKTQPRVADRLKRVATHMDHARAALDSRSGSELQTAYKSYSYALHRCEALQVRIYDRTEADYWFDYLVIEEEKFWGKEMGLGAGASKKDFKTTITGKDKGDATTGMSAAEALNLLAVEATETFKLLEDGKDREMTIVGARSNMHKREAEYAAWVIEQLDEKERGLLKDEIEAASKPLAAIRHWLYHRTGTKKSIGAFSAVETAMNSVRKSANLGTLEKLPVRELEFPAGEEAEATEERGKLDSALLDYATEIQQTWAKALTDGIQDWYELAQHKDQVKPSFMRNLLGFAATALLGNFGGMFAKQLMQKFATALKPDTVDALAGSISDTAQAVAGPMLAAGDDEAKDDAAELKALQFMRGALNQGVGLMITRHVTDLTGKKDERNLTTDEVRKAIAQLKGSSNGAQKQAKLDAATEWSRYVAQSALRKARKEDDVASDPKKDVDAVSTDVTKMDDYFGEYWEKGKGLTKESGYKDSRLGTAGVLRVEIKHQHRPRHMKNDPPELIKADLNGMNSEMAKMVAESGGNILSKIPVPKEIFIRHFHFGSVGNYNTETSLIAVDETGRVTDYVNDGAELTMNGELWWALVKDFDLSGKLK